VNSAIVQNYLVTREGLSDDLVYQMTKTLLEDLPSLQAAHAAAKDIKLGDAAKGAPVPLHPGAAKYYKEKGAP
jgi:TRAP transporter TAXI family solute receptor